MTETTSAAKASDEALDEIGDEDETGDDVARDRTDAETSEAVTADQDDAENSDPEDSDGDEDGDDEDEDEDGEDSDDDEAAESGTSNRSAELFHQSEIAADYVEGLLDILDLDGDIDELVVGGRPMVEVIEGGEGSGRRLQMLVGTRGVTLEALQELTRLAVYRKTGSPSRLLLDVGGYRTQRRKELSALARNAVEKVKSHGEVLRLEPMSAFERKCVHDVINATAGVESESEGVEPNRRIVISPVD